MAKQVILYFSNTGHTEAVAQKIAAVTGAQLVSLQAEQPYTAADLDWNDPTSRTSLETHDSTSRPGVVVPNERLIAQTDTIFLGSPLWWGQVPHVINTLLETGLFRCKDVRQFCTSGSTPIAKSTATLKTAYPAINWGPSHRFTTAITGQEVEDWLKAGNQ